MGYFTDINNNDSLRSKGAQYTPVSARSAQKVQNAQYVINSIMGFGFNILSSATDGKGGADSKNLSVDEQKKTLEKQLDKALKAVGVDNVNSIDNALTTQNTKVSNSQKTKEAFYNSTDEYSVKIENLRGQKVSGANLTEEQVSKNNQIDKQIKALEKDKEQAKKAAEKTYAKEVKIFQEMSVNADTAKNINIQLQNLKSLDDSEKIEPKYDVKQEVTDLSDFNKAREKFLKHPSKETALALEEAFKSVDSEKTISAYNKYLKPSIECWKSFSD